MNFDLMPLKLEILGIIQGLFMIHLEVFYTLENINSYDFDRDTVINGSKWYRIMLMIFREYGIH